MKTRTIHDLDLYIRWIWSHSYTIYDKGLFKRQKNQDEWVIVHPDIVSKEILNVLEKARPEGCRVTLRKLRRVFNIARRITASGIQPIRIGTWGGMA